MHLSLDSMTRRPRVSEFFKELWTKFPSQLCGGIMNSYDGKYGRCFVSWFFWKDVFFFFFPDRPRFRTPFFELGSKKSMIRQANANAGIWYVQASQMDPIQRNSMEVGVLVDSFCSFLEAFHGLWATNSCRRPILKSKVFKCMFALRISLCVSLARKHQELFQRKEHQANVQTYPYGHCFLESWLQYFTVVFEISETDLWNRRHHCFFECLIWYQVFIQQKLVRLLNPLESWMEPTSLERCCHWFLRFVGWAILEPDTEEVVDISIGAKVCEGIVPHFWS